MAAPLNVSHPQSQRAIYSIQCAWLQKRPPPPPRYQEMCHTTDTEPSPPFLTNLTPATKRVNARCSSRIMATIPEIVTTHPAQHLPWLLPHKLHSLTHFIRRMPLQQPGAMQQYARNRHVIGMPPTLMGEFFFFWATQGIYWKIPIHSLDFIITPGIPGTLIVI